MKMEPISTGLTMMGMATGNSTTIIKMEPKTCMMEVTCIAKESGTTAQTFMMILDMLSMISQLVQLTSKSVQTAIASISHIRPIGSMMAITPQLRIGTEIHILSTRMVLISTGLTVMGMATGNSTTMNKMEPKTCMMVATCTVTENGTTAQTTMMSGDMLTMSSPPVQLNSN